jgi:hypothetical protein
VDAEKSIGVAPQKEKRKERHINVNTAKTKIGITERLSG